MSVISEEIHFLRELGSDPEIDMFGIKELQDAFNEAADTIEMLSKQSTTNDPKQWIPCSEKFPNITVNDSYSDDVLTVLKWYDGDITYSVGWYNKSGCWNEDSKNCEVIAWMPIPTLYKERT